MGKGKVRRRDGTEGKDEVTAAWVEGERAEKGNRMGERGERKRGRAKTREEQKGNTPVSPFPRRSAKEGEREKQSPRSNCTSYESFEP